jgi:dTDP-4-amino-4,6-dideoxygalactose transaminase
VLKISIERDAQGQMADRGCPDLSISNESPIYVTRPFLPPLDELLPLLERIWATRLLTNNGPIHNQFETQLRAALTVDNVSLVANGTVALTTVMHVLGLSGEVITTPYSFVATSHVLRLQSLIPVFADIRPEDLNLDAGRIEAAITPRTVAIMPVHCYGNPCDTDAIERIAQRNGLCVIYDAAHAFGVLRNGTSVLQHGDFSTLSFHATKVFNTFEGGAIVARTAESKIAIDRMKNFGFRDELTVDTLGMNAKMSEFNAALGLIQLKHFERVRAARRLVDARYRTMLAGIEGISCIPLPRDVTPNYSYFPILVGPAFPLSRDALYERLKQRSIFARRYFYPLITSFPMYSSFPSASPGNLPVATKIAGQILCLPIYSELSEADQARVVECLISVE